MCNANNKAHTIMGKRLNQPQGFNLTNKIVIAFLF